MSSDFDPYHRWLGIPPEEQPPDHYRLLGVSRFETDREVISNASDQRMTHLRTFSAGKRSADSQRLLNEVSAATHCLLDKSKKAQYDAQLKAVIGEKERLQAPKPLPVARPIAAPLVQPVALPQATIAPLQPTAYAPQTSTRRPVRRRNNSGPMLALLSLVPLALVAAGGFYVYNASREVVESPPKPPPVVPHPKPDSGKKQPKPDPDKTKPEPEPDSSSPRSIEQRTAWFSPGENGPRNYFRQKPGKAWEEFEENKLKHRFDETARTADYVELQQEGRGFKVRLYSDRVESTFNQR